MPVTFAAVIHPFHSMKVRLNLPLRCFYGERMVMTADGPVVKEMPGKVAISDLPIELYIKTQKKA